MRMIKPGRALFGVGMAGLGVLSLIYGDFALNWQPVPQGIPWRELLARVSGGILLAGGAGLAFRRSAMAAALALAVYLSSWVLLLQAPRAAAAPTNVGAWLGVAESLTLTLGGFALFAMMAERDGRAPARLAKAEQSLPLVRFLFAVCCLIFGLSHFVYPTETASMIPAWLPARVVLAGLTGAAHTAAGLGLLLGLFPRLAATLEAAMMTSFVVLVHLAGVLADPTSRLQWTMIFVAMALSGAAWAIAGSLAEEPWGWSRRAAPAIQPT